MLKFGTHQKIKVSKIPNGEIFNSMLLSDTEDTLIITRPRIDINSINKKFMEHLYPKNNIYINYEFEGIEYFFRTHVLKSSYTPFPYIILKYPEAKNIKTKKLRQFERYKCLLPVQVALLEKEFELSYEEVYAIDISLTGIGIISKDNLPEKFLVNFQVDANKIFLLCEQKTFKANHFGMFNFYGCKIIKIRNKDAYKNYINTLNIVRAE